MRRTLLILFLLVWGIRLHAQSGQHVERSREQTDFGAEGDFQKPIPMPAGALQSLRMSKGADDSSQECAEKEGIPPSEIPASWFVASEIRLSRIYSSGLVVRGEHACLGGAHIAQFWVLAKSNPGYSIVFRGRADALTVMPTRSNGFRNLQLVFITQAGAYVDYVNFRYSQGAYHKSGHHLTHPN
jgi:hypothetical protein